jgi:hypothetical protein
MKVCVGDNVVVDSEKAGTPPREGVVLEVIEAEWGTRFRVRWIDGHESTIHPVAGTIHVTHREKQREPSDAECADCNEALAEVWR